MYLFGETIQGTSTRVLYCPEKYADYLDSHDNIILQSVRTEQERLQSDMGLAYQMYSQVASQLQVARAKIQEEKPVFAVLEPAVVPLLPSGISKKYMFWLLSFYLYVLSYLGIYSEKIS